jgi:hypothetical protein
MKIPAWVAAGCALAIGAPALGQAADCPTCGAAAQSTVVATLPLASAAPGNDFNPQLGFEISKRLRGEGFLTQVLQAPLGEFNAKRMSGINWTPGDELPYAFTAQSQSSFNPAFVIPHELDNQIQQIIPQMVPMLGWQFGISDAPQGMPAAT